MRGMTRFSGLLAKAALVFKPPLPRRSLLLHCLMTNAQRRLKWMRPLTPRRVSTKSGLAFCCNLGSVTRQPVGALVFGVAIMALDPNPFDLMTGDGLDQVMP